MRFLSCFSGIEAASVAWHTIGWQCVGVAELEPFPCAVLDHHYPGVPNLGDVTADGFLDRAADLAPDVLVGGPPCQDFSVAGLRAGIYGDRGNLTLRWVQIIHAINPRFVVTENVPGWLSANGGHAFGAFLAGLVGHDTALVPPKDCGGKWTNAGMVDGPGGRAAWRILDAQYFGLAQRRRRVFVVFCPRCGADPAAVLFEPASLRGHPAPRREARERVAPTVARGSPCGGRTYGLDADTCDSLVAFDGNNTSGPIDISTAVNACHTAIGSQDFGSETFVTHSLRADGFDAREDGTGRGTPLVPVAFGWQNSAHQGDSVSAGSLTSGGGKPGQGYPAAQIGAAVRRLTPTECERLQGFHDGWTDVPYRGKPAADGNRYKALGNSMAVPCMAWIGRRIAAHEAA